MECAGGGEGEEGSSEAEAAPAEGTLEGHLGYLHDAERNAAYAEAIAWALAAAPSARPRVVDVGTGSGLLALMAARAGAAAVAAFECIPELAKLAARNARLNGLAERVQVLPTSSLRARPAEGGWEVDGERGALADILVSELLDTDLIGEGLLPSLRHAASTLAKPDCVCVPHSAAVFAQVVHAPRLWDAQRPSATAALRLPREASACPGLPSWHLHLRQLLEAGLVVPLTAASPVLEFEMQRLPPAGGRRIPTAVQVLPAAAALPAHAVAYWWTCELTPVAGGPRLDTGPHANAHGSRDHWRQGLFLLPSADLLQPGSRLWACHDEDSLWFGLVADGDRGSGAPPPAPEEAPICTCGAHSLLGRLRWLQLADARRTGAFESAIRDALAGGGPEMPLLDLGDGPLLTALAARSGAGHAVCVEAAGPAYARLSAECIACTLTKPERQAVEVLRAEAWACAAPVGKRALSRRAAELLLLEPSWACLQGLWAAHHLAHARSLARGARAQGLVAETARTVPRGASVFAALLQCGPLHARHQPAGRAAGVLLEADALCEGAGRRGPRPVLSLPVWAGGGCSLLSEPQELAAFALEEPAPSLERTGRLVAAAGGTAHAVLLFLRWDLGGGAAWRAGPPRGACRGGAPWSLEPQGLHLLPAGLRLRAGEALEVALRAALDDGDAWRVEARAAAAAP